MKKNLIFLVFLASIFVVSCGGGSKTNGTTGICDTVTDEDTVDTDSVSDTEPSGGDTEPTENPDSENPDSVSDGGDSQPDDDADTVSDGSDADTDDSDLTADDDADSDSVQVNPCDPNPCLNVSNSTKECIETDDTTYSCKCEPDYDWTGSLCQSSSSGGTKSLGNICTGQDKCYASSSVMEECPAADKEFYGQDAQYTEKCTAQSFSSTTNVVIDNNSGLTWEKSPSSSTYTWADRAAHCDELNSSNYGGKSNWRVPNPLEFLTIVDNSRYNPATDSNFKNMPTEVSDFLWTSREYGGDTSSARAFNPYYGWYSHGKSKTDNKYKVLCVSGSEMLPAASGDFTTQTINGKDVVTDSKTGLMWQKEYVTDRTWQQALAYCQSLNGESYGGYSDWRLPNKNELASLLDPGKSDSPYSNFPEMPDGWFWTSSTYVYVAGGAWCVNFSNGYVYSYIKGTGNYVRCVR